MKIKTKFKIDTLAQYCITHPNYLYTKENTGHKYASMKLWINAATSYNRYDSSITLRKENKDDKAVYVGNGQTDMFNSKLQFEKDTAMARLKGQRLESPFFDGSGYININMTKIKEYLMQNPRAKNNYGEIDLIIHINNETNDYGDDISILIDTGATNDKLYVGNGKSLQAILERKVKKAKDEKPEVPQETGSNTETSANPFGMESGPIEIDDLPF